MLGLVPKPNQHSPLKRAQTYGTNHSRQSSPVSKNDVHSRNNGESNSKPSAPPSPVRTPSPQPRLRDSSKISSESSTLLVRRLVFDSPKTARSEIEQTVPAVSGNDGSIATFEEHIERNHSALQPNLQQLPVTFEAVTIPGSLTRQIRHMEADFALLQQVKDVGYFQRGRSNSITNAEESPRDRLKNPRFRSNPEPEMLALALVLFVATVRNNPRVASVGAE